MTSILSHGAGRIPRTLLVPEAIYPPLQAFPRDRRNLSHGHLRLAAVRPRPGHPTNQDFSSLRSPGLQHLDRGGVLFLVGWTVIRLCRRFSRERAALYIEQKQPKLRNNLINSLQLYPEVAAAPASPRFFNLHGAGSAAYHTQAARCIAGRPVGGHPTGQK